MQTKRICSREENVIEIEPGHNGYMGVHVSTNVSMSIIVSVILKISVDMHIK